MKLIRGRVVGVTIPGMEDVGSKMFLVVSNNRRNAALGNALVVRLTTSNKPDLTSIVPLSHEDRPLVGKVLCDDMFQVYDDEVEREVGVLSPTTMNRVDAGLKVALGLR